MDNEEMLKTILYQVLYNRFYVTYIARCVLPPNDTERLIGLINEEIDATWNALWKEQESDEIPTNQSGE